MVADYWQEQVDHQGRKSTSIHTSKMSRAEYVMLNICSEDFSKQMEKSAINVTAELKDGLRAQLGKHVDGLLDTLFRVKSLQDQGKATKTW